LKEGRAHFYVTVVSTTVRILGIFRWFSEKRIKHWDRRCSGREIGRVRIDFKNHLVKKNLFTLFFFPLEGFAEKVDNDPCGEHQEYKKGNTDKVKNKAFFQRAKGFPYSCTVWTDPYS
jgi:hypothetical protein